MGAVGSARVRHEREGWKDCLRSKKDLNAVSFYEFVHLDHLAASIGAGEGVDPEESDCPVNIFVGEIRIRGLQQRVHGLPAQNEHQQTF